jgi:predicted RNA-binding Zn ribbon-like protein
VDASAEVPWRLADPDLAVALLCTVRLRDNVLVDELADKRAANDWLGQHQLPLVSGNGPVHHDLVQHRDLLRGLFTAVVNGTPLPRQALKTVNAYAARAPVTLTARRLANGDVQVDLISQGTATDVLFGQLSRSTLALLAAPARGQLEQCRAPGCILFFLKQRPRQLWCSAACGNRARVARHYARHAAQ